MESWKREKIEEEEGKGEGKGGEPSSLSLLSSPSLSQGFSLSLFCCSLEGEEDSLHFPLKINFSPPLFFFARKREGGKIASETP